MADLNLMIAGQTRPYPGQTVSGDAWFSMKTDFGTRVTVIDGAGHGPLANLAAETAMTALREVASLAADQALSLCHSRLHGTRGAVISIVDITPGSLSFAGVGNVDARVLAPMVSQRRLSPDRGLLGAAMPKVHTWSIPVETTDWRLIMFSDGVMQRMSLNWDDLENLGQAHQLVEGLITRWGRDTDDATIVIAGPLV